MTSPQSHFDIDASIVLQLGEDLVTDVVQALVELVKNSYDADATYVKLEINAQDGPGDDRLFFSDATGSVVIEDDGTGMTKDAIDQGWLTISNSPKRRMKRLGRTTKRGRVPLGDKGLGRLGSQRLGENIEIFTQSGSGQGHHVGWSWSDFNGEINLTRVPVKWERYRGQRQGTRIVVTGLRDAFQWKDDYDRLRTSLSQLLSPYSRINDFDIIGTVDGRELELVEISDAVRKHAHLKYLVKFDEKDLAIRGLAKLAYLKPAKRDHRAAFETLVESDNGEALVQFILGLNHAKALGFRRARSSGFLFEFTRRRKFDHLDKAYRWEDGSLASPGPFEAEVDSFNLGAEAVRDQDVFDHSKDYREYVKAMSGVRIYRDGFGIRVDRDWLGLSKQQTEGSSYYGLRPENTLGFVSIGAKDNAALTETTDREGFVDTAPYRNFIRLFEEFVSYSHGAQEFMRRSTIDYLNACRSKEDGVDPAVTVVDASASIEDRVARLSKSVYSIEKAQKHLDRVHEDSSKTFDELDAKAIGSPEFAALVHRSRAEVDEQIGTTSKLIADIAEELRPATTLPGLHRVLQDRVEALERQIDQSIEVMGLGITAEILSHEIANIVDQLATRTRRISRLVDARKVQRLDLLDYFEYIRAALSGLRRQLGHLAPSLRFARAAKSLIDIDSFCTELTLYHNHRLRARAITILLHKNSNFRVRMNRGKLTQVLDNLILNSEYWLAESIKAGRIASGSISITISDPRIRLSDNGLGIDEAVETTLFEPFISTKRSGRGLGLYIARELLESEGCGLWLAQERNANGRQYQFEADFSGCVVDGSE